MDDKLFALLTVLSSGLFSLLVVLVTNWMAGRIEKSKFGRQLKKENIDSIRLLYEDAIFHLHNVIIDRGQGTEEKQDQITRVIARLDLRSTDEIRNQYQKIIELAQNWARHYRASQPKRVGDYEIIKSSNMATAEKSNLAESERLYPDFYENFTELKNLMVSHLKELSA